MRSSAGVHAEPRVDHDAHEVDSEIDGHDEQGEAEDERLEHREVAVRDGVHQETAHPRELEERLDDDAAGDGLRHLHAEDRDRSG